MYIEFGMAQKYIDDLSRNVKRGLKTKTEKGWCPGVAPVGYLNNTVRSTGENNLVKDPERFPLVRRIGREECRNQTLSHELWELPAYAAPALPWHVPIHRGLRIRILAKEERQQGKGRRGVHRRARRS